MSKFLIIKGIKLYHADIQKNYGQSRWFPRCELSKIFCEANERKAMNDYHVLVFKKYGFEIEEVDE